MVGISVIIPCYNVEEYLEECLDSVVNQTFEDFEIICINDGSTDDTLDILEKYSKNDNRIRIINQSNGGLAISRNVGLDNACGKYVCFLDSDDYMDLNSFKELFEIAEEKSLDVIFYKLLNFNDKTRKTKKYKYFEMGYLKKRVGDNVFSFDDVRDFLFDMNVTAPGKLFNRDFIADLRFPEGLIWEDNAFFIEMMINAKRVYFYDKYLYYRRMRETSIIHSFYEKYPDCITIFNLIADTTKKYGCYEEYESTIFVKKLYTIFQRFSQTDKEYKWNFFNKIKEDFLNYPDDIESEEFFHEIKERYRVIFKSGISSETPEEFEYTVKNFDLKVKNDKLMDQIKEYKRLNNHILNSLSWKITKPLRKFSKKIK